jgi:hypothetical protein
MRLVKMNTTLGDFGAPQEINHAMGSVRNCSRLTLGSVNKHGCEHFHHEVGEYWKPANLVVEGDMNDLEVLKQLSEICDEHNLKVHTKHTVTFSNENSARLVVDNSV